MEDRTLGKTGLRVLALGFGCGAVGGILVRASRREMLQVVGRALELGVTYFDTAAIYGDSASEEHLGLVLAELGGDVIGGTKVRLAAAPELIEQAVIVSVEGSLRRLRRDCIDLIQLHTPVAAVSRPERQRPLPAWRRSGQVWPTPPEGGGCGGPGPST